MNRDNINMVMDYAEQQNALVQITNNQGEWIADFASNLHAKVCFNEMVAKGAEIQLNPSVDGVAYFARLL